MKLTADRVITTPEITKLLKTAKHRSVKASKSKKNLCHITDYYLFSFTYYTGLRVSEVCSLRWGEISDDFLTVLGKGDKKRTVFFGEFTRNNLFEYKAHRKNSFRFKIMDPDSYVFIGQKGPLTPSAIHRRFKNLAEEIGLSKSLSFHSLRHGYATRLASRGVPIPAIRDQLGHGNVSTTSVYLHLTDQHKDMIKHIT